MTGQQPPTGRGYTKLAAAVVISGIVIGASVLALPFLQPQKTITTTVTQDEPCVGGKLVWNVNSTLGVTTPLYNPVLLMERESTAYVCVVYQSYWKGDPSKFLSQIYPSGFNYSMLSASFFLGVFYRTTESPAYVHNFIISASPSSIHFSNRTDFVDVMFTITALGNSTGFYDGSAPLGCDGYMPLAVGYTSSQVNASDFTPPPLAQVSCGPLVDFQPYSVTIADMNFTVVHFPTTWQQQNFT